MKIWRNSYEEKFSPWNSGGPFLLTVPEPLNIWCVHKCKRKNWMWGIFFYKFWFQTVIYWKKVGQGWEIIFKNLFIILLELLTWNTDGQEKTVFAASRSEQNCCLSIFNKEQYLLNPLRHHNCFVRGLLHDCKMNFHRSTSALHVFKKHSNCCQTFFVTVLFVRKYHGVVGTFIEM